MRRVENFLDTNILIYAQGSEDRRAGRADGLLAIGGAISIQVVNEFASVTSRKLRWPWGRIAATLQRIQVLCGTPRPLTLAVHDHAIALADQGGFAFYDALIVASALDAGCTTLLTEDMQDGRVVEGKLVIRNPFA